MEKFFSLLNNAINIEDLFFKLIDEKDSKKREALLYLLTDYAEKEDAILQHLSKKELDEMIHFMMKTYKTSNLSFDVTFLTQYFLHPNSNFPLLRVYHLLLSEKKFYDLQKYTAVSRFEASQLMYNKEISKTVEQDALLSQFESLVLLNLISLDEQLRYPLLYLYYTKDMDPNLFAYKGLITLDMPEEKLVNLSKLVYPDIKRLGKELLMNPNNFAENLRFFQAIMITLPRREQEDVVSFLIFLKQQNLKNIRNENIRVLNKVLENFSFSSLEEEEKLRTPLAPSLESHVMEYSFNQIQAFDASYHMIFDNTRLIWQDMKNILDSKYLKEPADKRELLSSHIQSLLAERDKILAKISNWDDFVTYISFLHTLNPVDNPFYYLSIGKATSAFSSLNDFEIQERFLEEWTVRDILRMQDVRDEEDNNYLNYLNVVLEEADEDNEKNVYIIRLEKAVELLGKVYLGRIDPEEFEIEFNRLNISLDDSLSLPGIQERGEDFVLQNYQYYLNKYLEIARESLIKKSLFYSLYIEHILDGDLEGLLEEDLYVPYDKVSSLEDFQEEDFNQLMELYQWNLGEIFGKYPMTEEEYQIVLTIYFRAIRSFLPTVYVKKLQGAYPVNRSRKLKRGGTHGNL